MKYPVLMAKQNRCELAEKLLNVRMNLAEGGYSIGGERVAGFRRW